MKYKYDLSDQTQEDAALLKAITEGERAGKVSRAEVFAVLQGRK